MSNDTSAGSTDRCPKCEEERKKLLDVTQSADFEGYDEVCGWCIRKRGLNAAREGERGQGQRPIGEQHALDRAAESRGSGWPR